MSLMSCQHAVASMMDFLEDRLPSTRREAFHEHMNRCPKCTEFIVSYRELPGIARRVLRAEPPRDLAARIRNAIATDEETR